MDKNISPNVIGIILAFYSIGMVIMSFTMDSFHRKVGTKKSYIFGTSCGVIVSLLAIALNYEGLVLFICTGALLRFIDGMRETQFEVAFFVYISENILDCTTEKMQGRAISIYKAIGSVGFLVGSLQGPLFLKYLKYDGSWCFFLAIYVIAVTLAAIIYPDIDKE